MPAVNRVTSPRARDEGLGGCADGNSHLQAPTGQLQVGDVYHIDDDRLDASPHASFRTKKVEYRDYKQGPKQTALPQ